MNDIYKQQVLAAKIKRRGLTDAGLRDRLVICSVCPEFNGNRCARCGCDPVDHMMIVCNGQRACPIGKFDALSA